MASGISEHKWLRQFALAILLYIGLLPLWYYSLGAVSAAAAPCASFIYSFFDGRIAINPVARGVQLVLNGKLQSNGVRMDLLTHGWPMLVALIIVTRSNSLQGKLRALAIGSSFMFVLTIFALMLWARMTTLELEQQAGPGSDESSLFFLAFHGYAFSQPAVALLIWLMLIVLGAFKTRLNRERGGITVSRNATCPCGSGRKFKRCCGA